MIRLSRLTDPVTVDLSEVYPGVSIVLRRLTSPEIAEARDVALDALREAKAGLVALAPYGLDGSDANGVRLNPLDLGQMTRCGRLVGAVELALAALISWTGIEIDDGQAAPINRETLSILLLDDGLERRVLSEIEKASRILVTEGNGSGGSPDGSTATPPKMTADQVTAPAARPPARPAPKANAGPPGGSARKPRTRHAP